MNDEDFTTDNIRFRARERVINGLQDWKAMYGSHGDNMITYSVWTDKTSGKVVGVDRTSANSISYPQVYDSCDLRYVRAIDELDALKKCMGRTE